MSEDPLYYFSLKDMNHLDLFKSHEKVWNIVLNMKAYIDSFTKFGIHSEVPSQCIIENSDCVYIGKNVHLEPFSYIKGPCIIEDGASISHGALVRPYTIIEKEAVIGHCSEVKGSFLFPKAKLAHFNYVGDSIIGEGVNLGAGAICANVRLDKKPVILEPDNSIKIESGTKKFGAIVGDGASIACNVVLSPGTFIKPKALVLTNTRVKTHHLGAS